MATSADLARAVMAPGSDVIYIDKDNKPAGHDDLGPALSSGRAFMIQPREGVLVIDLDEPGAQWYPRALLALREIGCDVVRVGSGRPGHEHAWIVGPVGWDGPELKTHAVAHGVPNRQARHGAGGRTRPPCSPHRLGGHGQLASIPGDDR